MKNLKVGIFGNPYNAEGGKKMHPLEIRKQIDFNNKQIEEVMKPNSFVLNSIVRDLLNENVELQNKCLHDFINGFCIYCDKEEEE